MRLTTLRNVSAIELLERRVLMSAATPFQGQPQGVPGTVEFEKYDAGGEGVAYHDTTPTNDGGQFRNDGVDIIAANDAGGGYAVTSTNAGEWLNYTVNVASSTVYSLNLRVACGDNGGSIHLNVDGEDRTGPIAIANTGGWQSWKTIAVPNVFIAAGQHSLRFMIDSAADPGSSVVNLNWMQLRDDPATSARTQWWRDAHFGMFIHWGLYSQLAGHWNGQTTPGLGEWIMNDLHIPLAQYMQVENQFNPTQFNAAQWVQIAKQAGMQYMVITSKHHDGFSLWPTSVNNYNITATPFGRDPLAELSSAAKAAGIHFGVYYSILNWADPNASAAGIDTYMQTMETQLRELITHYGPDILWFDGEWPTWWTDERGRELEEFVRNLKPSIIINNRVGKRLPTDGDYDTPEQSIPPTSDPGRLWETAMTLNDTWGYKDTDNNWKSPATIVKNLADIVSKGGNYLLNVGPTGQGIIPAGAINVLQQVGTWVSANAQAIYGATSPPVYSEPWGSITRNGNSLYAIVSTWPTNGVLFVRVPGAAAHASLLNGTALSFTAASGGININVPTTMPQLPATVIRIDFNPSDATGSIAGQVFRDSNNNGVQNAGETGLAGVTVYLDANGNGKLDAGEITATTDALGRYTFSGLTPGTYTVRQALSRDYRRSAPLLALAEVKVNGGQTTAGPTFADVPVAGVPINFAYLLMIAQNFALPGTFATGDLNDDGEIDFKDLLLASQNYNRPL